MTECVKVSNKNRNTSGFIPVGRFKIGSLKGAFGRVGSLKSGLGGLKFKVHTFESLLKRWANFGERRSICRSGDRRMSTRRMAIKFWRFRMAVLIGSCEWLSGPLFSMRTSEMLVDNLSKYILWLFELVVRVSWWASWKISWLTDYWASWLTSWWTSGKTSWLTD